MTKEIAKKYGIKPGEKYEPHFQFGEEVQGTGVLLEAEPAIRFAEQYEKGLSLGKLFFVPSETKH